MHPAFSLRTRRRTDTAKPVVVIVPMKMFPRAVTRNRVHRQITEAFRRMGRKTAPGTQYVITVRQTEIPHGLGVDRALFELLRESDMVIR